MDGIVKIGIVLGDRLKLYKLKKLGFMQEYFNLLLFNNSNEFMVSE